MVLVVADDTQSLHSRRERGGLKPQQFGGTVLSGYLPVRLLERGQDVVAILLSFLILVN